MKLDKALKNSGKQKSKYKFKLYNRMMTFNDPVLEAF